MPKEFDLSKYSKLFVSESKESIRMMNDSMLELEKDPSNSERVNEVFRACHTIKGMAGMMNLKAIAETAHALEDVLGKVRDGALKPTEQVAEVIFKTIDEIESMVKTVEKSGQPKENPELIAELKTVLSAAKGEPEEEPEEPEEPAKDTGQSTSTTIQVRLGRRCSLPSARAMVILKELAKASTVTSSNPSEEEIEHEPVFEEFSVVVEPKERFQEALRRVISMPDVEEVLYGHSREPKEKWQKLAKQEQATGPSASEAVAPQTVRVGMDKLDDLLDNVGELVIGRSRLIEKATRDDDHDLMEISAVIDRLTSDIQSRVLGIRMIPLDVVMSRFPRMVRDIAKSQGKDVELVVEGGSIELDRTVVDKITEPMMHLLRNCIDHGLETPEERQASGKRSKGLIRIVASKQQDHVLIEVSDDGRGIDFERIREAAVTKGVLTKQQAESALGRDLLDLLFRPGFSTKTQVSEVSGRGVGLDVVRKNVQELGGSVIVNTSKGAGTTFSLWLPFTLAIIDAMLVQIADQTYALAMSTIVESHHYKADEVKTIRSREVVQLRGEVLPLIRAREFFGLEKGTGEDIDALIVQSRDRRAALQVDELLGHQQIVVKGFDQRLRRTKGISGGTILGSGRIALILDVDSILGG
ncbi:MAG: chemotaxis protein CheA [Thermoplasmata archaeon]|nr:chemotaxis protein CheA [Thermoplasmata archaeon]